MLTVEKLKKAVLETGRNFFPVNYHPSHRETGFMVINEKDIFYGVLATPTEIMCHFDRSSWESLYNFVCPRDPEDLERLLNSWGIDTTNAGSGGSRPLSSDKIGTDVPAPKWENVYTSEEKNNLTLVERFEVPGGWMYAVSRVTTDFYNDKHYDSHITFVPFPTVGSSR